MQKILVVDDSPMNRELLDEILKDDYQVVTAEDGMCALWLMEQEIEEIAAVISDLMMPRMDGYALVEEMKCRGWLGKVPVLIISSENAVEAENHCFELGVTDFIHKPFVGSVVKNRVKNTIELFVCKNALEQKVKEQAVTLEEQRRIIRRQTEKLKEMKSFNRLMMEFRSVIMEVETRLKVLNAEFSEAYNRNPFEAIKSRLKSPESIYEKLERRGFPVTVESIRENLTDVAGLRVICSFPDDIYRLADLLIQQDDILLKSRKDYIKNPKGNGYRSLHLILSVPIYLPGGKKYMNVEVQFRTIAMDFWASLEHQLKYKQNIPNQQDIVAQLKECADVIALTDQKMIGIRQQIEAASDTPTEDDILLEKLSRMDMNIG